MANGDNLSHATARDVHAGEGGWWHGTGSGCPWACSGRSVRRSTVRGGRVSHRLTSFLMLVSAGLLLPVALLVSAIDVVRPRGSATCCSVHLAGSTRVVPGRLGGHHPEGVCCGGWPLRDSRSTWPGAARSRWRRLAHRHGGIPVVDSRVIGHPDLRRAVHGAPRPPAPSPGAVGTRCRTPLVTAPGAAAGPRMSEARCPTA